MNTSQVTQKYNQESQKEETEYDKNIPTLTGLFVF